MVYNKTKLSVLKQLLIDFRSIYDIKVDDGEPTVVQLRQLSKKLEVNSSISLDEDRMIMYKLGQLLCDDLRKKININVDGESTEDDLTKLHSLLKQSPNVKVDGEPTISALEQLLQISFNNTNAKCKYNMTIDK